MGKKLILQVFEAHPYPIFSIDSPSDNTNYRKAYYVVVDGHWVLREMSSNMNNGYIGVAHSEEEARKRLKDYIRKEAKSIHKEKEGYTLVDRLG